MSEQVIAFIGGGNMAYSLIGGLIIDGHPPAALRVAEPDTERRERLAEEFGVQVFEENATAARGADAVILAVKPAMVADVARDLSQQIQAQGSLVISVAAGIRSRSLAEWLGKDVAIVRAMPNTPALVRTGSTALFANAAVAPEQHELAETTMRAVGIIVWLTQEDQMDAVTALSGSGPAYFFYTMEAMQSAGQALGLDAKTARLLTLETALGAARMALESSEEPAELRRRVTSPGGTTAAAIDEFDQANLLAIYARALEAAAKRAHALGDELEEKK